MGTLGAQEAAWHCTLQIADKGASPGSDAQFVYCLLQLHVSDRAHTSLGVRLVFTKLAKL